MPYNNCSSNKRTYSFIRALTSGFGLHVLIWRMSWEQLPSCFYEFSSSPLLLPVFSSAWLQPEVNLQDSDGSLRCSQHPIHTSYQMGWVLVSHPDTRPLRHSNQFLCSTTWWAVGIASCFCNCVESWVKKKMPVIALSGRFRLGHWHKQFEEIEEGWRWFLRLSSGSLFDGGPG